MRISTADGVSRHGFAAEIENRDDITGNEDWDAEKSTRSGIAGA